MNQTYGLDQRDSSYFKVEIAVEFIQYNEEIKINLIVKRVEPINSEIIIDEGGKIQGQVIK